MDLEKSNDPLVYNIQCLSVTFHYKIEHNPLVFPNLSQMNLFHKRWCYNERIAYNNLLFQIFAKTRHPFPDP